MNSLKSPSTGSGLTQANTIQSDSNNNTLKRGFADTSLSHYDPLKHSAPKKILENKAEENEVISQPNTYSEDLMDINDTEQLEFLARQLKATQTDPIDTGTESHIQQQNEMFDQQSLNNSHAKINESPELMDLTKSPSAYVEDPIKSLRIASIPILDNLASQIIYKLTIKWNYADAIGMAIDSQSPEGQALYILTQLFLHTRTLYTSEEYISATELEMDNEIYQRQVIQKANLASFLSGVFCSAPTAFPVLCNNFLDTFLFPGSRLLKPQGALYLELMTQAYISIVKHSDQPKQVALDASFPNDIDEILLKRRRAKVLAPSEADFVQRVKRRKEHLIVLDDIETLSNNYSWQAFIRDVSEYVSKNLSVILTGKASKGPFSLFSTNSTYQHHTKNNGTTSVSDENKLHIGKTLGLSMIASGSELSSDDHGVIDSSEMHSNYHSSDENLHHMGSNRQKRLDSESTDLSNNLSEHSRSHPNEASDISHAPSKGSGIIGSTQLSSMAPTSRTQVIQRHPWTKVEEEALLSGLRTVEGPFWAQILELYGPGGSISEVLKDRNQVQLKDKARNLKLYYLKTGTPLPAELKAVTGDMKSKDRVKRAKKAKKQIPQKRKPLNASSINNHEKSALIAPRSDDLLQTSSQNISGGTQSENSDKNVTKSNLPISGIISPVTDSAYQSHQAHMINTTMELPNDYLQSKEGLHATSTSDNQDVTKSSEIDNNINLPNPPTSHKGHSTEDRSDRKVEDKDRTDSNGLANISNEEVSTSLDLLIEQVGAYIDKDTEFQKQMSQEDYGKASETVNQYQETIADEALGSRDNRCQSTEDFNKLTEQNLKTDSHTSTQDKSQYKEDELVSERERKNEEEAKSTEAALNLLVQAFQDDKSTP